MFPVSLTQPESALKNASLHNIQIRFASGEYT